MDFWQIAPYMSAAAVTVGLYLRRQTRMELHHLVTLSESLDTGLVDPPSLHPIVDPARCLGTACCVKACHEGALGIIDGKAVLVNPTACIGHGACAPACHLDAIQLVFGTEKRGIELPQVTPTFETNVPGIFIAGELGGMGLIRNAAEQGKQAMEAIGQRNHSQKPNGTNQSEELDLVIVGSGPAGLSASLAAKRKGLKFVTLEQEDSVGGSILHYPRRKIAMTAPMQLPIVGKVRWHEISKESLVEFWTRVMKETKLPLRFGERMETLRREESSFSVLTAKKTYRAKSVLLSIGRRGTPRKLDIPGEQLEKVVYRLLDPQQYRNRRVLVVGGGDSALEAALAVSDEPGAKVALSYRGKAFSRVKGKNRQRFEAALTEGRLQALMESVPTAIERDRVIVQKNGKTFELANDIVIVCAGGVLPTPMLREIGVMIETHYGTQAHAIPQPLPS